MIISLWVVRSGYIECLRWLSRRPSLWRLKMKNRTDRLGFSSQIFEYSWAIKFNCEFWMIILKIENSFVRVTIGDLIFEIDFWIQWRKNGRLVNCFSFFLYCYLIFRINFFYQRHKINSLLLFLVVCSWKKHKPIFITYLSTRIVNIIAKIDNNNTITTNKKLNQIETKKKRERVNLL